MGQRTSIYLPDDLAAKVKSSRIPLAELVRRGLNASGPVDEATLRHILREELAHLPTPDCRAQPAYNASSYQTEHYLQDP